MTLRACCVLFAVQCFSKFAYGAKDWTRKSLGNFFPESDSPYTGDAPTPLFGDECAEVLVIKGADLTQYGQIVTATYHPPSCSDWSQVVLQLHGAVRGVQYDRFGAVWLSGVEILRLTTPEPTPDGITWHVFRDITSMSPILKNSGNMTLQIPNVVDKTYTGVLRVDVSLKFYRFKAPGSQPSRLDKVVRHLRNWTSPNIFNAAVGPCSLQKSDFSLSDV